MEHSQTNLGNTCWLSSLLILLIANVYYIVLLFKERGLIYKRVVTISLDIHTNIEIEDGGIYQLIGGS